MPLFRTEAIACLPQIVTLRGCEERLRLVRDQRGTKLHHDANTLAAAVSEKAHLRTKRR